MNMPEPQLNNEHQYQPLHCIVLGFNLSPQFNFNSGSGSGSNGRLGVSFGCIAIDKKSTARAQPDPTQNKTITISQALYKTTSTDRVPEVHGDPWFPRCTVAPYGLSNPPESIRMQAPGPGLCIGPGPCLCIYCIDCTDCHNNTTIRVLSQVKTLRRLPKVSSSSDSAYTLARVEYSHFETRLL
jgi:hypothetical protein